MCVVKSKWLLDDVVYDVKYWLYICILCVNMTVFFLLFWGIFDNLYVKLKVFYLFSYLLFFVKWVRNLFSWIMLVIIVNLFLFIGSNKNV